MTADKLSDAAIAAELQKTPRWSLKDGTIARSFKTAGWPETLLVVNAIGHLAQAAWHHPDLVVGYDRVEVRLSTHDAGGITDKDFALARRIEDVIAWRPAAPLDGPPKSDPYILADAS